MDKTTVYLELVLSQPLLLAPIFLLLFCYFLIPEEKRLFLCLVLLVPWLTIARSPDLGPISAAAKISSGGAYLLIAISAWAHPGPKRSMPFAGWLFVFIACMAMVYIISVQELLLAFVLRSQWICVTLAGVLTARTIVTHSDLMRIINALTLGCLLAIAIPASNLLLYPEDAFLKGSGRWEPYNSNSNQTGMLFALATPLFAYAAMTFKRISWRPIFMWILALTIGMALLTASRQTMLAIAMVMVPVLFKISKRPIMLLFGIVLALIAIPLVLSMGEQANLERLGSLETGRLDIWSTYWSEVFPRRPLVGLLGSKGESYFKAVSEVGMHPHNAWFYLMYVGGITLMLPMLWLTVYSSFCGYKMWKVKNFLPGDPLVYSILFTLLIAMYIQGLFNQVVYWPTYTWSYLHVVLACWFIAMWHDIRDGNLQWSLLDDIQEEEEFSYDETEVLEDFQDYDDPDPSPNV
ncbi:MAG: hypothetical protein QGI78_04200 [Phycisphaerales bacterium]|nr:hypothetical protein [Phycisphaerales bacterium]